MVRDSGSDRCSDDVHRNGAIEGEARSANLEKNSVTPVDDAYARALEYTKRAQPYRVSVWTAELDDACARSDGESEEGAGIGARKRASCRACIFACGVAYGRPCQPSECGTQV